MISVNHSFSCIAPSTCLFLCFYNTRINSLPWLACIGWTWVNIKKQLKLVYELWLDITHMLEIASSEIQSNRGLCWLVNHSQKWSESRIITVKWNPEQFKGIENLENIFVHQTLIGRKLSITIKSNKTLLEFANLDSTE